MPGRPDADLVVEIRMQVFVGHIGKGDPAGKGIDPGEEGLGVERLFAGRVGVSSGRSRHGARAQKSRGASP